MRTFDYVMECATASVTRPLTSLLTALNPAVGRLPPDALVHRPGALTDLEPT